MESIQTQGVFLSRDLCVSAKYTFAAYFGRRANSVLIISEHAKLTQCNVINKAIFC